MFVRNATAFRTHVRKLTRVTRIDPTSFLKSRKSPNLVHVRYLFRVAALQETAAEVDHCCRARRRLVTQTTRSDRDSSPTAAGGIRVTVIMIPAGRGGGQYPDDITVTGTVTVAAFKLFKFKFIRVRRGSRDQPASAHHMMSVVQVCTLHVAPVHPDIRVSHDCRVVSGGRGPPACRGETMTPAADWMMRLP
jgi:hypothetical protein